MRLNSLGPAAGSKPAAKRRGRGIGSGLGKTGGRGVKGQKSRSGGTVKPGFEGGQMPLYMRMPKSGFNNKRFATNLSELTLGRLQEAIDAKKIDAKKAIDEDALVAAGVVGKKQDGIKLLTKGELKTKVDLKITKATKSAQEAVEKAGGKIEFITREVAPIKNGKAKGSKKA